jgi:hypothetical protein
LGIETLFPELEGDGPFCVSKMFSSFRTAIVEELRRESPKSRADRRGGLAGAPKAAVCKNEWHKVLHEAGDTLESAYLQGYVLGSERHAGWQD